MTRTVVYLFVLSCLGLNETRLSVNKTRQDIHRALPLWLRDPLTHSLDGYVGCGNDLLLVPRAWVSISTETLKVSAEMVLSSPMYKQR